MNAERTFVLSIAGFDPSAGAGVLADIKTFEMHHTYGFGVCTSITFQNHNEFDGVEWVSLSSIQKQLTVLFRKYEINVIKIGLIESLDCLNNLLDFLLDVNRKVKIIWDPILKASAGFDFHERIDQSLMTAILSKLFLVTPNLSEAARLANQNDEPVSSAVALSKQCNVLLKGGHRTDGCADDLLITGGQRFPVTGRKIASGEKHGSGCVLSAAIAACLTRGMSLQDSCIEAKKYMNSFLASSDTLLGHHLATDLVIKTI